jgi:hypothetical protein
MSVPSSTLRLPFLIQAFLFEGALAGVGFLLAFGTGIAPFAGASLSWRVALISGAATLPLLAVFLLCRRYPVGPLRPIQELLDTLLGPYLAACGVVDLLLLAAVVGISEEILFRGVAQPWLVGALGEIGGLLAASLLFGLAHAITPTYAVLAGLAGLYLGICPRLLGGYNLYIPALSHGLYDLAAFLLIRADVRRRVA